MCQRRQPRRRRILRRHSPHSFRRRPGARGDARAFTARQIAAQEETPETINIGVRLPLVHLDGLDQQFWPRAAAANWLAAEVAKAKKRGVQKPFVLVDLAKFLPPWAGKAQPDEDEEMSKEAKDLAKALRGSADGPARADLLPWTPWHLAYDGRVFLQARARSRWSGMSAPREVRDRRGGFAADVVRDLDVSQAHRLAGRAQRAPVGEARSLLGWSRNGCSVARRHAKLGLIYDFTARQTWSERAAAGAPGFDIEVAARALDPVILRQAEQEFDRTARRGGSLAEAHSAPPARARARAPARRCVRVRSRSQRSRRARQCGTRGLPPAKGTVGLAGRAAGSSPPGASPAAGRSANSGTAGTNRA